MLDFGLSDAHHDTGGKREIAPFILAEDTEGLGDSFEDALSANLDRVLDTCGSRQETLQVRTAITRNYHFRLLFANWLEPADSV
jgi:hypothetical protein